MWQHISDTRSFTLFGAPKDSRKGPPLVCMHRRCEHRAASMELEDWDTGETVRLALDPAKNAVQNAEALYKRAGKQRRAVAAVAPLLDAAQAEVKFDHSTMSMSA